MASQADRSEASYEKEQVKTANVTTKSEKRGEVTRGNSSCGDATDTNINALSSHGEPRPTAEAYSELVPTVITVFLVVLLWHNVIGCIPILLGID